jgi:hypothetical protein
LGRKNEGLQLSPHAQEIVENFLVEELKKKRRKRNVLKSRSFKFSVSVLEAD